MRGRIRTRLALAIVLTALIPVGAAVWLARSMVRHSSSRFFLPEIGERLNQSLELYQELAQAIKARMRAQAQTIALSADRLGAQRGGEGRKEPTEPSVRGFLRAQLDAYPDLAAITWTTDEGAFHDDRERTAPEASQMELVLEEELPSGGHLDLRFTTRRERFEQLSSMGAFLRAYSQLEQRREADESSYVAAFAVLLGLTVAGAVGVGTRLARGVSMRVARLERASQEVGSGNLEVRVEDLGSDELGKLARAFNHMLDELEAGRTRIEYLQQIASWQGMARRLAHEIKNPLTPIQLAVEELHQRYRGDDARYRALLDTTLDVVRSEVETLRRLVVEFSQFAQLPSAELSPDDLYAFLRGRDLHMSLDSGRAQLSVIVPETSALVALDRHLMRRVLINLVANAAAATAPRGEDGRIEVRAEERPNHRVALLVDDNGPGVPDEQRSAIFEPYVTHSKGGTGLGLAIVKKIVVEHHGRIVTQTSPLGGARLCLELPLLTSADDLAFANSASRR